MDCCCAVPSSAVHICAVPAGASRAHLCSERYNNFPSGLCCVPRFESDANNLYQTDDAAFPPHCDHLARQLSLTHPTSGTPRTVDLPELPAQANPEALLAQVRAIAQL